MKRKLRTPLGNPAIISKVSHRVPTYYHFWLRLVSVKNRSLRSDRISIVRAARLEHTPFTDLEASQPRKTLGTWIAALKRITLGGEYDAWGIHWSWAKWCAFRVLRLCVIQFCPLHSCNQICLDGRLQRVWKWCVRDWYEKHSSKSVWMWRISCK